MWSGFSRVRSPYLHVKHGNPQPPLPIITNNAKHARIHTELQVHRAQLHNIELLWRNLQLVRANRRPTNIALAVVVYLDLGNRAGRHELPIQTNRHPMHLLRQNSELLLVTSLRYDDVIHLVHDGARGAARVKEGQPSIQCARRGGGGVRKGARERAGRPQATNLAPLASRSPFLRRVARLT